MQLYKKYQVRKFSDFVGNKYTVKELANRARNHTLPTVCIFMGSSGRGKTALGTTVAAYTNCTNPVAGEPCGECMSCKSIFLERFSGDVHLYDGSKMGKDEINDLEERASLPPMTDKKRFIIIDEFQQLSSSARGATLKLLEKKRKDTHFILCSMDTNIDPAILSRGLTYKFLAPTFEEMLNYLVKIINIEAPDKEFPEEYVTEVLPAIIQTADGNVRLALDMVERSIESDIFTAEALYEATGIVTSQKAMDTLLGILNKDLSTLKTVIDKGLADTFHYAYKVMASSRAVVAIGNEKDWRFKGSNELVSHPEYQTLWNILEKVKHTSGYQIDENFLIYELATFMTRPRVRVPKNV